MSISLSILLAAQALPPTPEEYQYERRDVRPFKLAGILLDAQAIYTHFGEEPRIDDARGFMAELQLRLGEIYYYRIAGYSWDAEEDLPGGEDVDLHAGTMGLGWDWTFGAFPQFGFDMGAGIGLMRARSDRDADTGFYVQWEGAVRLRITSNFAVRVSGFMDFVNLHFNTDDTEDFVNFSLGAGLELSF